MYSINLLQSLPKNCRLPQSLVVMPGCTLEVWDKGSGLQNAKVEESKSYNAGNYKDNVDRYDRNKLVFSALKDVQIVEEINDDFDDMDEDIESYRWDISILDQTSLSWLPIKIMQETTKSTK